MSDEKMMPCDEAVKYALDRSTTATARFPDLFIQFLAEQGYAIVPTAYPLQARDVVQRLAERIILRLVGKHAAKLDPASDKWAVIIAEEILAALPPVDPAGDAVERVAEALWRWMNPALLRMPSLKWADIDNDVKEQWREGARAALATLPAGDVPTDAVELQRLHDAAVSARARRAVASIDGTSSGGLTALCIDHDRAEAAFTAALPLRAAAVPEGVAEWNAAIEAAAKVVTEKENYIAVILDQGKGEHGKSGYVVDATWNGWCGQRSAYSDAASAVRALARSAAPARGPQEGGGGE